MNVKQINSQSDLTSTSSFAVQSYLTVRSSLCIILTWDAGPSYLTVRSSLCIILTLSLYNLCQTGSSYLRRKPYQCPLRFNEQITTTHFLLLQPPIRPVPAEVILLWKGRQNFFEFMNILRNFAKSIFAHIFTKLEYFAKVIIYSKSPDHVPQNDI